MAYKQAFLSSTALIKALGEANAHMMWAIALYLEEPDAEALASEGLTDGNGDRKIDFIFLDRDAKRVVFAQGYYAQNTAKNSAPANKASDLNTAAAWLLSGDTSLVPKPLGPIIEECRAALEEGEVESIELLYVHNLPESVNVNRELQTAAAHMRKALGEGTPVRVISRELGSSTIDHLFATQESHIEVKDEIPCPSKALFTESGPKWEASVLSVPGVWLHNLFTQYGDALFSANYRGFLGITKRRRINTGIRQSAETKPSDFWVFNNGITLLTLGKKETKDGKTTLTGLSVINGAQTTGSIGSVDTTKYDMKNLRVLCRIITCSDPDTISEIVKYNNTQNEITTWDQYSNDPEQNRIFDEFQQIGFCYSRKRGFRSGPEVIGIEDVAQPLLAFHGKYQDATRGKNLIFERKPLYRNAFEGKKATHVLLAYTLARAIDERRLELKRKSSQGIIITLEEAQLSLLRNLRFKSFLVAVVARCLESILGRKVDYETVAFRSESVQGNSIYALAASWSAVVEAVLSFVATQIDSAGFGARSGEEELVETVAKHVSAILYAGRKSLPFDDFVSMIADS